MLDGEFFATMRTDTILSLIRLSLLLFGEGSNAQMSLIVRQQIGVDSLFVGHILIEHQLFHLLFECYSIEWLITILIV